MHRGDGVSHQEYAGDSRAMVVASIAVREKGEGE